MWCGVVWCAKRGSTWDVVIRPDEVYAGVLICLSRVTVLIVGQALIRSCVYLSDNACVFLRVG